MAFHWTYSSKSTPFLSWRAQNWTKHSRCGLTSAEGKAHLPQPVGNALMQPRNLLALFATKLHYWLVFNLSNSIPGIILCKAAFRLLNSQSVLLPRFIHPQVQDFALLFAELHGVPVHSFLQTVEVPLNDDTSSWGTNYSSQYHL